MQKSLPARAESLAFEHELVVKRAASDGVITPEEITQISQSAMRVHRVTTEVHRAMRKGISVLRVGYAAPWIDQELGHEAVEESLGL